MWYIFEKKSLDKVFSKLPEQVLEKYEVWKQIVQLSGPIALRNFKGFHDEPLKGERKGQRSSRLNLKYRIIYTVENFKLFVFVEEIIPHNY